jgi:lipopolysaccharide/colanic/teichoic acid biosynthesis glycosyltransferase
MAALPDPLSGHLARPGTATTVSLGVAERPDASDTAATQHRWRPADDCRYRGARLRAKRLLDLVIATGLLVVAIPLLAIIGLAVAVSSPGPVIYRQTRVGRHDTRFRIRKFRTMHADADERLRRDPELRARYLAGGFKLSLAEDPRITRLGALLRKTSLDELPQLVNVIRGEMSLVGPRPVVPEELEQYGPYRAAYLEVYPGLTGAWQVSGRDAVRFPGRAMLDAEYLDGWSLGGDLRILALTIPAALTARGVE